MVVNLVSLCLEMDAHKHVTSSSLMLGIGATMTEGVSKTLALCSGPLSPPVWEGDDCRDVLWFRESRRDSLGLGIGGTSAMLLLFCLFLS